jgi:translation initiation factor IF-3
MSKKTRKQLKAKIVKLKAEISDLQWEVDQHEDEIIPADYTDMDEVIFEAEGRKMEGREFGPWLLKRVKRFVSYG